MEGAALVTSVVLPLWSQAAAPPNIALVVRGMGVGKGVGRVGWGERERRKEPRSVQRLCADLPLLPPTPPI